MADPLDVEAARALCEAATLIRYGTGRKQSEALALFPAALDEIETLRRALAAVTAERDVWLNAAQDARETLGYVEGETTDDAACRVVAALAAEREANAGLRGLLAEAQIQIVYLHEKFQTTGSGNAVLSRIDAALETK